MATPREVRRLAFQILYQLDARGVGAPRKPGPARAGGGGTERGGTEAGVGDDDLEAVRRSIDHLDEFSPADQTKAFDLAVAAYNDRRSADAATKELAPTWPAHRQAAVDRAILRLAHYEMTSGRTHPKIAVNEAVELAKTFSTERSPAFINGLLDKVLKRVLRESTCPADAPVSDADLSKSLPPPSPSPAPDAP